MFSDFYEFSFFGSNQSVNVKKTFCYNMTGKNLGEFLIMDGNNG